MARKIKLLYKLFVSIRQSEYICLEPSEMFVYWSVIVDDLNTLNLHSASLSWSTSIDFLCHNHTYVAMCTVY